MIKQNINNAETIPKQGTLPSTYEMKNIILNLKKPMVIESSICDWKLQNWNLKDWATAIGNKKLPFRTGQRLCTENPQWERTCSTTELTLNEFISSLDNVKLDNKWMYFDYKYMHQWFKDNNSILESVSWENFGFPEVSGSDSTMWLGTEGAHTPCHYDSYSLNIVAQMYGRKMWVMFPPHCTHKLKPTRVPYEESSVYSNINFYCGNSDFSGLDEAYFVILEPGDVLIMPNQWWHYVENLSTAISINTWIPLEEDDDKRLEECLIRNFISSTVKDMSTSEQKRILNPNEETLVNESVVDIDQLNLCVERCIKNCEPRIKMNKSNEQSAHESADLRSYKNFKHVNVLPIDEVVTFLRKKCKCNSKSKKLEMTSVLSVDNYINAFCNPDVIVKVKEKLLNINKVN